MVLSSCFVIGRMLGSYLRTVIPRSIVQIRLDRAKDDNEVSDSEDNEAPASPPPNSEEN
jgi:hypothetical protein